MKSLRKAANATLRLSSDVTLFDGLEMWLCRQLSLPIFFFFFFLTASHFPMHTTFCTYDALDNPNLLFQAHSSFSFTQFLNDSTGSCICDAADSAAHFTPLTSTHFLSVTHSALSVSKVTPLDDDDVKQLVCCTHTFLLHLQ